MDYIRDRNSPHCSKRRVQILALAGRISDDVTRNQIAHGQCYAHATSAWLQTLEVPVRDVVVSVFSDSLKLVWIDTTAIAGASFFVVFVEKEINLRDSLETEYGMESTEKSKEDDGSTL
ncbi:hypothetical protein GGS21DRAFT_233674 [Xylaria nigripes]|nr:hypothetical protein GGS21DRAFT_233674 [Xylaria nigripes]